MATSFDINLEKLVREKLQQAIADKTAAVMGGQLQDHAAYRYNCGVVQGYYQALDFVAEALDEIQKGP